MTFVSQPVPRILLLTPHEHEAIMIRTLLLLEEDLEFDMTWKSDLAVISESMLADYEIIMVDLLEHDVMGTIQTIRPLNADASIILLLDDSEEVGVKIKHAPLGQHNADYLWKSTLDSDRLYRTLLLSLNMYQLHRTRQEWLLHMEKVFSQAYVLDAETLQVEHMNVLAKAAHGYENATPPSVIFPALFKDWTPKDSQELAQILHENKIQSTELQKTMCHANGVESPVDISLRFSRYRWAKPVFLALVQDRTEQQQLKQAQKMEAVGQIAGGIAHDFNNILTIISGNLELLGETEFPDEDDHELVKEALTATRQGAKLISELMRFSRPKKSAPEAVMPIEVIKQIQPLLKRSLKECMTLEISSDSAKHYCHLDAGQLENTLLNLTINARDAMAQSANGMLQIIVDDVVLSDPAILHRHNLPAGDYVVIQFKDNGCGMAQDTLSHIFEPFFTTKKTRGSGLGLSMVYQFVTRAKGAIDIDSHLDVGTTVSLYFPVSLDIPQNQTVDDAILSATEKPGDINPSSLIKPCVLLVEDDARVRRYAKRLFERLDYRVIEAENADMALHLVDAEDVIDLLFTDVVMPGNLNGFELCQAVRKRYNNVPTIVTSGYNDVMDNLEDDGCLFFLQKPYDKQALETVVQQAIPH